MSIPEQLAAHVAEGDALSAALLATDDGIGCQYRLRAGGYVGVETLAALTLVKPIRQRIPTCDEHGCPLRAECRFARLFSEGAAGRSGKKFRLTPLGDRARRDPAIRRQVADAALTLPLAARILATLAAHGPQTIFTLNTALLDESLAALAHDGTAGEAAFERGELADGLTLLGAIGALDYDGYRVAPTPGLATGPDAP
jgi:hypothetical protein